MKGSPGNNTSDMKVSTPVQEPVLTTKLIETHSTLSNSFNLFNAEPDLAVSENYSLSDNQLGEELLGPNENSDEATICKS